MKNEKQPDLIDEMIEVEEFVYGRLIEDMAFLLSYSLTRSALPESSLDDVILPATESNSFAIAPLLDYAIGDYEIISGVLSNSDIIPEDLIEAFSTAGEKLTETLPEDISHAAGKFLNDIYFAFATIGWIDDIYDNSTRYGMEFYDVKNDKSDYSLSDLITKQITMDDFDDILEMSNSLFYVEDGSDDEPDNGEGNDKAKESDGEDEAVQIQKKIADILHRLEEEE